MSIDRRQSRCYSKVEEKTGRWRCNQEIDESVTKATCCCTIGKAWGPRCELHPQEGSEEYEFLCPNNNRLQA
ncbi:Fibrillin-1 [Zootermopsis nevadensis]|uniref:Fibrillin-1 n=1 Tax=Zootermopsis nevadensis TaxID=136037 RepID=A0A067QQK7_ZOONE|nr:Fibrillin-1 [Zootermopsis nevadensis]